MWLRLWYLKGNRRSNLISLTFFSHAMALWHYRRSIFFITSLFSQRTPTVDAAAPWSIMNAESSGSRSAFTLQARGASDVVKDIYFIPAIVSMTSVLLFSFLCCYWLGWCFNRERMQRYYSRTTYPTSSHLAPQRVFYVFFYLT